MGDLRRCAGGLISAAIVACGPSPKPAAPDDRPAAGGGAGGGAAVVTTGSDPTPAAVCARILELKATDCESTSGFDLDDNECREEFRRSFDDRGPDARTANLALGRCLIDNESCDAVGQCVTALHSAASGFRACGTRGNQPVGMPRPEWSARKAATVTRYGQVTSTMDEPIEVCGVWDAGGQVDWLLNLTCDDGSRPFRSDDQAHAARVGNVGPGGRCDSIIDLYEVPCDEGSYKIYIDAYVCPLPE